MKRITAILLTVFIMFDLCNAQNFLQKGFDIDGEAANDFSGISVSMPDIYTLAIGAYQNDGNGSNAGQVRIFRWDGSSWVQKGLDIDGEAADDRSGVSISMPDSITIAIGAHWNDENGIESGHVRIYRWNPVNGGTWVQKGLDINGEAANDYSGYSVSMPDSNTVAIGAPSNADNGAGAGHVRIYSWSPLNGGAWIQKGLDIDGEAPLNYSGWSVSMPDSNIVAIGAYQNNGSGIYAGHVRIYKWNGSIWTQKGIDIDGENAGDYSGYSISMPDSNIVAIGATSNDGIGINAGHVRIYRWDGNAWLQKGDDIDGEAAGDNSGHYVSMSDSNTLAIGARYNDGNGIDAGHVRIYRWNPANGGNWIQKGNDIDGEAAGDISGISISMPDSNTLAIGAIANDGNGNGSGHTRVYSFVITVNVIENNFENTLTAYPNPSKAEINIDLKRTYTNLSLIVRNQLGQDIFRKTYSNSRLLQIELPGDAGVYFIEVQSENKKAILKVLKE